jgi:zinc D-Ala-D-Ala carboxypeptidase
MWVGTRRQFGGLILGGIAMMITKNFSVQEIACHCGCGTEEMDPEFMRMLQELRDRAGFAFRISSGRRCENHNSKVSSHSSKAGIHTFGKAVDILTGHVNTSKVLETIKISQQIGFTGLGLNLRGERKGRFIHLDNRGSDFSVPAIWTY